MLVAVDFYEFPKVQGDNMPKGQRYTAMINVKESEYDSLTVDSVYKRMIESSYPNARPSRDQIKIMGWSVVSN